ncbi:hypothetical protein PC128_g25987, partial [Phytophthora cactorum]
MVWITRTARLSLLLVLSVLVCWCGGDDIMDMLSPFISLKKLAEQAAKDAAEDEAAVSVVDRTYPLASVEMDALMQMYRDCRTKESAAMRTWCIGGDGDSYVHEANESKVFCPRGVTTHPCTGRILRTNRSAGDDGAEFLWPWEGLRCDAFTDPTTVTHIYLPGEFLHCEIAKLDLSVMVSLGQLDLSGNQLFGDFPDWLGDMTMLRLLNLAENQLTGDIPSSLAGNDALEQINVSSNNLTASTLSFFDAFHRLQHLDISNNNIELQLPRSLLGSGFLRSINISHNGFHGDLPELPVFQFLESLDMSSNFLSGAIPPQLSLWGREDPHDPDENSSLSIVDVSNNLLSGDLPVISNLSALQHFNIRNNAFAGLVPEFPPSLHEFAKTADFDGNQLLCPMPAVLLTGNLTCVCGDGYTIKMTEDIVNTSRIKKSDASDDVDQMVRGSEATDLCVPCPEGTTARPGEVYDHVEWPRLALALAGVEQNDLVDTTSDRVSPIDVLIQAWTDTLTSSSGSSRRLHVLQVRQDSGSTQLTQIVVAVEMMSPLSTKTQADNRLEKELGDAIHQAAEAAESALGDLLDELSGSSAGKGSQESDVDHLADLVTLNSFRDALVRQFGRAKLFNGALSFSMVNVSMVEPPFNSTRALACPPGTFFSPTEDERVCLPCPIGSYSRTSGALKCEPCPRRTFSSEKGLETCKPCPLGSDASPDASSCVECSWFTYKCEGFWQDLIVAVCVGAALLRLLYKKIRKLCVGDQAAQQQDESVALMTAVRAHGRTFDGVRYAPMGMISADAMFGSIHDTD